MPQPPINFFVEGVSFNLKKRIQVRKWLRSCIRTEGFKLKELNFIFCSDSYLLAINQDYLKHDTFTDIITFDNSDDEKYIFGDIFISIDRVRENAEVFQVTEQDELHRIMVHGTLHLLGYKDKGKVAKASMTIKENYYLARRFY